MTYTEHKITLDIHRTVSTVSLSVKKGDTARRLLIHLAEKGRPYHIDDGCYAVFAAKKPDGKVVLNDCTIDGCVIIYEFTAQTVAAAGLVECEIILYGGNGKQLTSAGFNIVVENTIYDTATEVESADEYNALAELIGKTQKLFSYGPVAQAIVRETEGTMISVTDASNQALPGLRIFGKSTQDGKPSPDSPVEIVSVEAPVITVTDGTDVQTMTIPYSMPGLPVTSGGNYTDENGQQWICDEVDMSRGVYVQRVGMKVFDGTETLGKRTSGVGNNYFSCNVSDIKPPKANSVLTGAMSSHLAEKTADNLWGKEDVGFSLMSSASELRFRLPGVSSVSEAQTLFSDWADSGEPLTVVYELAEENPIPLTAEELEQYSALHTYKPNTTIYNDAGAYMAAEYVADTKTYIDCVSSGSAASIGEVTLRAADWAGKDSLYSQVVKIEGVTEYSQVDLTPSVEQLSVFYNKDLAFVTENDGGIVTVYAIGQKPENDYTIQVTITEVYV